MALNPNIQSEDVKKEVSIVQNQAESLVDQIGSSLKELRNIIGNLEEKIRNHEKRLGVLQETLLAPILLRSLRDEQLVKLFKKLQQVFLKSHWPDVIENTRQFRRGSFSCCVEHLKAYVNQLLKNNAPKKGEVNCLDIDQSKRIELIRILNECHAEFLLDEFWTELNSNAYLNIHEEPEYKELLEKAVKKEEDLSDNIMILINDAFTNDKSTESSTSTESTTQSKENQNNSQGAGAIRSNVTNTKRHAPY